jgi:branched-chain amino acid transport system ATP-binding protein
VFAGLAGAIFAPLMMFVAPDSFPFSQSIIFLLAVIVGGAGWVLGPAIGAAITVVLPELLSSLAEYRLLFFGALLLVVLWLAPEGVMGTLARRLRRPDSTHVPEAGSAVSHYLDKVEHRSALTVHGIGIRFGGVKAASDVGFRADPGRIVSLIGPNGAGKTTVLNMIGGFYPPDAGSIRLGETELAGKAAWRIARAGIARTYQTTQLFGSMSVLDNVLAAMPRGRLGVPFVRKATRDDERAAMGLLAFVGYRGPLSAAAEDLPHVDRRLIEIARALATRPQVLLLDEPAAGLGRADKGALGKLLRRIADQGTAVILVEHDITMVMGISDHIVVLDAGLVIAAGAPLAVRHDPRVRKAYLGDGDMRARPRAASVHGTPPEMLTCASLDAGYGALPVLHAVSFEVRGGEMVALLGANGAGKSTTMRAVSGLLRPVAGTIALEGTPIERLAAHKIAAAGVTLVPEGRQVFPELTVKDNLLLGAWRRRKFDAAAEIEALLHSFPRLRDRLASRAGLLSGGEQQMLALARGLIARPRIFMLDEPSLGLAPAMINEVFDILAQLRDAGVTILLVDQMAELALTVADRVYVLESGSIARGDTAAALANDPFIEAAYLGGAASGQ